MDSGERGMKRFSGDVEDSGKAVRQWKSWALAKIMTLKDLAPKARAPWIYTLLDGSAWEAVEHLSLHSLAVEGGDIELWKLMADRFPEKEASDLMGEALGEVFGLVAAENETAKEWTARCRDTFDRCKRRANTDFPATARGWICLNCAGLSEEQKAIIKAKMQGSLEFDDISKAFRSCFPMYKAGRKAKKPIGAMAADVQEDAPVIEDSDADNFEDVQSFLADHHTPEVDSLELSEGEAAEALAVSWKERRTEINKVNQARRFSRPGGTSSSFGGPRRNFRSEIDDIKKRTRCRNCGKMGRWARECRAPKSGDTATGSSQPSGAGYVEVQSHKVTFVGSAFALDTGVDESLAAGLVSSPGFGVVGTGCGKTLIGQETLTTVETLLAANHRPPAERVPRQNTFRFGNGATERSDVTARIPVGIGGRTGLIEAAVIRGKAPLLLQRPTLQKLGLKMDFQQGTMTALDGAVNLHMECNPAGQVLLKCWIFRHRRHHRCQPCLPIHPKIILPPIRISHALEPLGIQIVGRSPLRKRNVDAS